MLANPQPSINEDALITEVEALRVQATNQLSESTRVEFGQFLTPPRVAELIAELFSPTTGDVHLLEAGASVGSLIAAALVRFLKTNPASSTLFTYRRPLPVGRHEMGLFA